MKKVARFGLLLMAAMGIALGTAARGDAYRSPLAVAAAPDGKRLYVSDKTAGCVVVFDVVGNRKIGDIPVPGEPNGLAISADGKTLYVAQRKAGSVAVIDTAAKAITGTIPVGPWPTAVTLAPKNNRLITCNRGNDTVSIVALGTGKILQQIAVTRDPACAAVTPDETRIVVGNYMPRGRGTDPELAAEVTILDAVAMQPIATVKLPPGSTAVSGVAISPDGRWAYVVHTLGRFNLPITQLERGWVHTYALSILDIAAGTRLATTLLDDLTGGAADPWDIAISADGARLWISHAGTHEVSTVDVAKVHDLLEGNVPEELAKLKDGPRDNVWVRIRNDRANLDELTNDLTALYIAGAIRRVPSGGNGPRGLTLSPDGTRLYVANYYQGTIGVVDTAQEKLLASIPVGLQPEPDAARRGEIYFHDATRCFQHWHSCASCHLDGGRIDGLPWDFMRDGIGNGKDVISLVYMPHTSPHNRRATRPESRGCMQTGVTGSHLIVPEPSDVDDLLAYVSSLEPEPNPNLPQRSESVRRGKVLFEGKADCAGCHPAPYFTDQLTHNVGVISRSEPDGKYDTPSLIEAYRTAPYYHDGRAATMKEALTKHNPKDQHGTLSELTPQEVDDLVAYVLSL